MDLIAHKFDGRRVAVQHEPIHSYSAALDLARSHLRFQSDTAAVYLQADNCSRIVRTYMLREGQVEVLTGEVPPEPTMYPGSLPGPLHLGCAPFSADEIGAMLERQDRLGYNRGFKVGIAHRNRERAAQLRRQADSLDRVASMNLPGSVREGVYGGGRQEGKTWAQSHPDWS